MRAISFDVKLNLDRENIFVSFIFFSKELMMGGIRRIVVAWIEKQYYKVLTLFFFFLSFALMQIKFLDGSCGGGNWIVVAMLFASCYMPHLMLLSERRDNNARCCRARIRGGAGGS